MTSTGTPLPDGDPADREHCSKAAFWRPAPQCAVPWNALFFLVILDMNNSYLTYFKGKCKMSF